MVFIEKIQILEEKNFSKKTYKKQLTYSNLKPSLFITRTNCALDRSTIWCLYVPGFQRQVLKNFQNVSGFHKQNFSGFCIYIPTT